jgi:hypothetical protein
VFFRLSVVAAAVLLYCSAAIATTIIVPPPQVLPPGTPVGVRGACDGDAKRFCNDVPFGQGRRIACLEQHEAQLTPACKPRLKFLRVLVDAANAQTARNHAIEKAKAEAAKKGSVTQDNPAPPAGK